MMLRKQIARKTMTFFCNDVPHKSLAKQLFQGEAPNKSKSGRPPQIWLTDITDRAQ